MTIQVHALDGLKPIAQITDYLSVSTIEQDLAAGAWELQLPDSSTPRQMLAVSRPGLALHDDDTGWWWGGSVTNYDATYSTTGWTHTFSGVDFQAELQRRLRWPLGVLTETVFAPNVGATVQPLTTSAFTSVTENAGPGAALERRIEGLRLAADPGEGDSPGWVPPNVPLLELFAAQFTGSAYTARLRYQFDDSATPVPHLLFTAEARPTSRLLLAVDSGQIESAKITESAAAATRAISPGDWVDRDNENLGKIYADAAVSPSGWRAAYTEALTSRGGLDADKLEAETVAWLAQQGPQRSAEINGITATGWGRDLDLGWLVRVRLGEGPNADIDTLPVVGSKLSWSDGAWSRSVSVGSSSPGGVAFVLDQLAKLASRTRRLERGNG